jgi:Na+/melibiose symporter-like transporter
VGLVSTAGNVALSILTADSIDYDELLCGKKRSSSYFAIQYPIQLFITIAGTSIPLALMSALGFEEPADDDDNDQDDDSNGNSTVGSTIAVRLWCSLFISFVMFIAYIILRWYKVCRSICNII